MALTLETLNGDLPVYGPTGHAVGLPGVVIVHGAEGPGAGWSHRFAAILASHGVLAAPLAYGTGDIFGAGDIREVDLRLIPAAGHALAGHSRCGGVGLFGWSRGGEAVCHVAALDPTPFACIAAHAPADICVGAFDAAAHRKGGDTRPTDPDGARAWVWPGHDACLVPGREIEIERCPVPIFLSVGDADEVWDPQMTLRLAARLKAAGRAPEMFVASGQGHGFDFDTEPRLWMRLLQFFERYLPAPHTLG